MNQVVESTSERSPLSVYAFLKSFPYKLKYLATRLAEPENWKYDDGYSNPNDELEFAEVKREYSVLYQYIHNTFSKAYAEGKVIEAPEHNYSIMNTGLMTTNFEEIFMLFKPNNRENAQKWMLEGFYCKSDHAIPQSLRSRLPEHIDYFENNPEDMYFNIKWDIQPNIDHILDTNFDRLPLALQSLPDRTQVAPILESLINQMKKRILRNHRLVVPQYYKQKIMYLAPLFFGNETFVLAIEKNDGTYRANTILTFGMAYCNARLIMKPESNWLVLK